MFVVAGGSGQTGSVVADRLLQAGERVRLIARTPEKVSALAARGAEVVRADLNDSATIADAMRGARGVYLLVPPAMTATDLFAVHRALIASMSAAVAASAPAHVVCLSSLGAQIPHGTGPVASLSLAEQSLRQASPNVTFVRPAFFMESLLTSLPAVLGGVLPSFLRADRALAMVGTKDVGAVAAQALLDGPRGQRVLELEGPRAYTPIEAAAELSRLVNRPIRVQEVADEEIAAVVRGAGMSECIAELSREMFHAINSGQMVWEFDDSTRLRGPTQVHEVLAKLIAQASPG